MDLLFSLSGAMLCPVQSLISFLVFFFVGVCVCVCRGPFLAPGTTERKETGAVGQHIFTVL